MLSDDMLHTLDAAQYLLTNGLVDILFSFPVVFMYKYFVLYQLSGHNAPMWNITLHYIQPQQDSENNDLTTRKDAA